MPIRILIAEDHRLLREGLVELLAAQPDIEVVGQTDNGRESVRLAAELAPDMLLTDIVMPELNGIDAATQVRRQQSDIKIIVLSMHADEGSVADALAVPVQGYVLKSNAGAELLNAIRQVHAGRTYLSPTLSRGAGPVAGAAPGVLSSREREVLQLLAEGRSAKTIAADLFLSVKTVETHRAHIMEKLHLYSVPELTKYAIRHGLTPP